MNLRHSTEGMTPMARARAGAAFAALACMALASCARGTAAVARPPRAVVAATVERRDLSLFEEHAARISPSVEVNLTPKVGGRVLALRAEVGERVTRNQALLELDASDYSAQYRQAQATLGSAKASLARTSDSGQEQQVIQAQAAADQAAVAYDDAASLYDKTKRLYDAGAVPKQQLDDVEARMKSAGIQRDAALAALALVKDKAGAQASDIASGQVDAASAQADLAKSQLDATVLRSPISGRVSYRGVEVGELVGTSTLAFVVIDDSSVIAEAGLSDRQVELLKPGMSIPVTVPALGDRPLTGRVESVSPAVDPRSLLFAARIRLPNPDGSIKGGMIARLRLPLATRKGAVVAPEQAIFSENGGDYAFVAVAGQTSASGGSGASYKAEKRELTLGETDGDSVEVIKGLAPGELVVIQGKEFIGDGDPIAITAAPNATAP